MRKGWGEPQSMAASPSWGVKYHFSCALCRVYPDGAYTDLGVCRPLQGDEELQALLSYLSSGQLGSLPGFPMPSEVESVHDLAEIMAQVKEEGGAANRTHDSSHIRYSCDESQEDLWVVRWTAGLACSWPRWCVCMARSCGCRRCSTRT